MSSRPIEARWNLGARLQACPLVGENLNKPWREVPTEYLQRIVAELAHKPDIVAAASGELTRRRVIPPAGSSSTHTPAPPLEQEAEAPRESMAEYNERMNRQASDAWHQKHPGGAMPHISQMLQSKYLNKEDCRTPVVVTISGLKAETFGGGRGGGQGAETKWILYFNESRKGLKLNTTTISALAAAFGEHSEAWMGKKVRLYVDNTVMMAGQIVGGVRIQTPRGTAEAVGYARPSAFEDGARGGGGGGHSGAFNTSPADPGGGGGPAFDRHTGEIHGGPGNAPVKPGADADFDDDIPF